MSNADPATDRMRAETGHDCIACPAAVRDLYATAQNLLHRLDASAWSEVPRKAESMRVSLAKVEAVVDEHFAALGAWRRP